jgi:hypothetical protein
MHSSRAYARAQGDRFKDEQAIENTVRAVENGRIDPTAARAAINGRKWLAGKRHPKVFGDKQTIEQTGKDGGPIKQEITASAETLAPAMRLFKGQLG